MTHHADKKLIGWLRILIRFYSDWFAMIISNNAPILMQAYEK